MSKLCKKCNTLKPVEYFSKNKRSKDGLDLYCKECNNIRSSINSKKEQHIADWLTYKKLKKCSHCGKYLSFNLFHKKINGTNGVGTECKNCKILIDKNNWKLNKDSKSIKHKEYVTKNKSKIILYHEEYRAANKNKTKEYCLGIGKEVRKAYSRKYYHEKKKFDLKFKLSDRISGALRFRLKKSKNNKHWESLVGYTYAQLRDRLEATLPENLTWEDFLSGDFHIDHIIPLSYFEYLKLSRFLFSLEARKLKNYASTR